MRALSLDELTEALERRTGRTGLRDAVAISAEKMQTLDDFWPLAGFIFDGPADDPAARAKWLDGDGQGALADARAALAALPDPVSVEDVEAALRGVVEARHAKPMDKRGKWTALKKMRRRNFAGCHFFLTARVSSKKSTDSAFQTKVSAVF